mmetsp:Transcript_19057/g.43590  ORF Transcript_19057/g.43590 Transcript_19057/m.43590 type:complete len:209 (+) Transcript_19057:318-944(+)
MHPLGHHQRFSERLSKRRPRVFGSSRNYDSHVLQCWVQFGTHSGWCRRKVSVQDRYKAACIACRGNRYRGLLSSVVFDQRRGFLYTIFRCGVECNGCRTGKCSDGPNNKSHPDERDVASCQGTGICNVQFIRRFWQGPRSFFRFFAYCPVWSKASCLQRRRVRLGAVRVGQFGYILHRCSRRTRCSDYAGGTNQPRSLTMKRNTLELI